VAWPNRVDSAPPIDGGRAWFLVLSSRQIRRSVRIASLERIKIHKLDLQVELKETAVNQLRSTQLLRSSHLTPMDVGAGIAHVAFPESQGARP
jgi:hypothetical protein